MSLFRLALATSLVFFGACQPSADNTEGSEPTPAPEAPLISIETVEFDGLQAKLAADRGEGMLLNFWAMWCAPCVAELPELNEVAEAYRDRGGKVVAVSYDIMVPGAEDAATTEAKIQRFFAKRGWQIPVLLYDDVDYSKANEFYSLPGEIPATIAINKAGEIVDSQHGKAGKERFEEMMRTAMGLD
ncbi:MAG: thiol-disulfide isomerase/thioredoxin [Planctomycetota bacterium]|jgi:thiol-disulfide isomerase/thioredoxin